MTKAKIHQLLPTVSPDDAIGNETLYIQDTLRKMGYDSEIYAQNIHSSLQNKVKNYNDYKNSETNDIIIYHHSIGSDLFDSLISLKSQIIMIYHNITPPEFFEGTNNTVAALLRQGQEQLPLLRDKIDIAVGDSEFNRIDLQNIGYKKTGVLPILLDMSKYIQTPLQNLISEYDTFINILYVGRIAPNKKIEQIIRSFSYYNANINPRSNLFLVGRFNGLTDRYYLSLQSMIENAKIRNVHFITDADDRKLVTYYNLADIFITMSIHEGFCVPLVESMFFKVPIIAYNSTAIPYTLGDSGVLVKDETYEEIGELIDVIVNDNNIRNEIIEKQTKRYNEIYHKNNQSMISDLLNLRK